MLQFLRERMHSRPTLTIDHDYGTLWQNEISNLAYFETELIENWEVEVNAKHLMVG